MDSTNYLLQEGTLIRIKGDLDCDLLTVYKNRNGKFSLIDGRGTDVVGSTSYLKDVLNEPDIFYPNWFQIGDILEAEEVFLTNAIQGVRWVSHIKEQQFTEQKVAKLLINKINQLV